MKNDIKLNEELYEALVSRIIDYNEVKDLLLKGANPLGVFNEHGDDVLGTLFCDASEEMMDDIDYKYVLSSRMPKIMQLFIDCGFKPSEISASGIDGEGEYFSTSIPPIQLMIPAVRL